MPVKWQSTTCALSAAPSGCDSDLRPVGSQTVARGRCLRVRPGQHRRGRDVVSRPKRLHHANGPPPGSRHRANRRRLRQPPVARRGHTGTSQGRNPGHGRQPNAPPPRHSQNTHHRITPSTAKWWQKTGRRKTAELLVRCNLGLLTPALPEKLPELEQWAAVHRTASHNSGVDRLRRRRRRLPLAVVTPAGDGLVGSDSASVAAATFCRRYGRVLARARVIQNENVVAPARDGLVGLDRAHSLGGRRDGGVLARGRVLRIEAPAGDGAVDSDRARVLLACRYSSVSACRRGRLTGVVVTPADESAVGADRTRMPRAC